MKQSGSETEFWCSSSLRSEEDETSESCKARSKCLDWISYAREADRPGLSARHR